MASANRRAVFGRDIRGQLGSTHNASSAVVSIRNTNTDYIVVCAIVFCMVVHAKGIVPQLIFGPTFSRQIVSTSTSLLNFSTFIPFYFFSIVSGWKKQSFIAAASLANPTPLLLVLLCLASTLWSTDPSLTFITSSALVLGYLGASTASACFSFQQLRTICGRLLIFLMIMSVFYIFALPSYGVMQDVLRGSNQGVFTHKNIYGSMALLCMIIYLGANGAEFRLSERFIGMTSAISGLYLADSAASTLTAVIVFFIYALLYLAKAIIRSPIGVGLVVAFVGVFAALALPSLLDFFLGTVGRDNSFTGRDTIWAIAQSAIDSDPILGHAYSAYWRTPEALAAAQRMFIPSIAHAHNLFLEMTLQVGWFGGFLTVAALATNLFWGVSSWLKNGSALGRFATLFTIAVVVRGMFESVVFNNNDLWTLVAFYLGSALFLERRTLRTSALLKATQPRFKPAVT